MILAPIPILAWNTNASVWVIPSLPEGKSEEVGTEEEEEEEDSTTVTCCVPIAISMCTLAIRTGHLQIISPNNCRSLSWITSSFSSNLPSLKDCSQAKNPSAELSLPSPLQLCDDLR